MEYLLLAVLFLILGGLLSFFAAIFDAMSRDDIEELDVSAEMKNALFKLQSKYEHSEMGLIFLEVLFYLVTTSALTICIYEALGIDIYFILWIFLLFLVIFLQRALFTGIANRFNLKFGIKFKGVLNIIFSLVIPVSSLYTKLVGVVSGQTQDEAAREEINVLVETAKEDGYIDEDEYRLIKNIMHFSEVLVSDVMTPRTVIFSYEAEKTIGEILNVSEIQTFSRFPIWKGKSMDDEVVGYIVTKEILNAALQNKSEDKLYKYARAIHYIPENATLDDAMEQFIKLRQHIFLVVDEYGGIEGLISMEDILENILGVEIVDEADRVVDMRELAKQRRNKRIRELYPNLFDSDNDKSKDN